MQRKLTQSVSPPRAGQHYGLVSTLTAAPPVLPSPHSVAGARSPSPLHSSFALHSPVSAGSPVSLSAAGRVTSELVIDMQQLGVTAGTASPPPSSRSLSAGRQSSSASPTVAARLSSSSFGSADGRSSRVGVIHLRPGTRRDLVVCYEPAEDTEGVLHPEGAEALDGDGATPAVGAFGASPLWQLRQRRFRLTFNVVVCDAASAHMHPLPVSAPSTALNSFTKRLRAAARVCTSFVSLQQSTLAFGDVNLGTKRTEAARLYNHSDLPALMDVSIVSQSIKVRQVQLLIPPLSPYSLKLDMVPRRVNADYHKHLSISQPPQRGQPVLTLLVTARISRRTQRACSTTASTR